MSTEVFMRGFFTLIIAAAVVYSVYSRDDRETASYVEDTKQRYNPYMPPLLLPGFLVVLTVMLPILSDFRTTGLRLLAMCFSIFLHISVYYILLLIALPLFRKCISARTCAALWLLPNYLYITQASSMALSEPLWVVCIPAIALKVVSCVWLFGFSAVLIWKIVSHLMFRRSILKDAQAVMDPAVLELWQQELRSARMKKMNAPPVVSAHVTTPLSIGFFRRSLRVVLPQRDYTAEELRLIFRHEIIHIGREDSATKFFMVFCTAMLWFNPLMWIAMRRSADDLELSCDETVLLDASSDTRRQYADLILRTAGDERGFTTCLSASAKALRYRLKNIVKPRKRLTGGILAGLIFFILIMSCGYVTLAFNEGDGAEFLFDSQALSLYSIQSLSATVSDQSFNCCTDQAALSEYLGGLHLYEIENSYTFTEKENTMFVLYNGPEGSFGVSLWDHALRVTPLSTGNRTQTVYYTSEQIDWDYLSSLLTTLPQEESLPFPPELMLWFSEEVNQNGEWMSANGTILTTVVDGEAKDPPPYQELGTGGVYNCQVTQVELCFSQEPIHGYTVQIEDWDSGTVQQLTSTELADPAILPLAPYSAHYTVHASFSGGEDTVYEMVFRFDVQLPEE